MQKVLRRSLLSRNQSLRRQRKDAKKALQETRAEIWRSQYMVNKALIQEVRDERRHRREDFALGPLAPRRDLGELKNTFGTRPPQHSQPIKVEALKRTKYINFAQGDRVAVVRGRERGKIGKVLDVDEESETLKVQGVNQVDLKLFDFQMLDDPGRPPFRTQELPLSIHDVRLVIPLKDPGSGHVKDVIIKEMYGGEPLVERHQFSKLPKHTRYAPGLDQEIPWPDEKLYGEFTYKGDTPRLHAEQVTYLPTLHDHPLPPGVIDECRNPYDKLRNDHEDEFMESKLLEEIKELHRVKQKLVTPETQFWEKQVEKKIASRSSTLSEETVRLIEETRAMKLTR